MDYETFATLPTAEIAELMRKDRARTCVFPFNGTRRWFMLEHAHEITEDFTKQYIETTSQAYISTYKLVFDHGIDTIVAPVFGGELFSRGEEYMREIGTGMSLLATHPAFVEFYKEHDIRVHFYGDYRKQLDGTSYTYICDNFDEITKNTAHHKTRRLFYGVCADDATSAIAELSVKHFQSTGKAPTRNELIEMYYGESIEKADIFIGFEKFNVFDYPMLGWGEESLYFTVAPSLYMNEPLFRKIVFDYLFLRPVEEIDYPAMSDADIKYMHQYYHANREEVFGTGRIKGGIWYENSNLKGISES